MVLTGHWSGLGLLSITVIQITHYVRRLWKRSVWLYWASNDVWCTSKVAVSGWALQNSAASPSASFRLVNSAFVFCLCGLWRLRFPFDVWMNPVLQNKTQTLELEKHRGREERREKENIILNTHINKADEMICVQTGWLCTCCLWPFGAVEACVVELLVLCSLARTCMWTVAT